ncbi:LysR family transcriptional regulator [Nitratidesulfovibrio sp. HK-II]|uniref:selenium metabolism-associated LysR family transcriptional regulator n=1 Tax=Nitratidesulfovibrio sp. HK-II TaxID=2009266 RepID=UPI000E2EEDF3|nr:selenium metabolism-associated LysR family transcriptional regulator [Nitratidesulfovibrio sp. HK-II]GBO96253.1 HTH-type transcriptional regulator CysL [Nitratidesulfovibrio sp. HK-II]
MLDFRRLEAFCKVYELRSFSRAGADLFLSQPTISAHVLALEKELGVRLLDRMGRQVLPTPAGEVLYRRASEAFASLAAAEAEIGQLRDEVSGDLVVGGSTIPAHHVLPEVIAGFVRTYPAVRVHLRVGDTADIVQRVTDGELMLGLVGAMEPHPDLVFEPLVDDELVVVAAPEMAGGRRHVQVEELAQWPWIMREAGSGTRRTFAEALATAGMDVRRLPVALVVDSTQAVVQYVRAGLGVSATSRLAVAESITRGELVELQLDDCRPARQFHSVRHARRHQFPAAAAFAAYLGEHTRHLRNGKAPANAESAAKTRNKDKA